MIDEDSETGALLNLVPGDTKISTKFWAEMIHDVANYNEWRKVLTQVVSYSAEHRVRYGFIVTDAGLTVIRITRQYVSGGLAAGRAAAAAAAAAAVAYGNLAPGSQQSSGSDISMGTSEPSLPSSDSYQDSNPNNWDFNLEYKHILWATHARQLTAKLALWALALMSLGGDNYIDYSYPGLNTWRTARGEELREGGIRHNTTGEFARCATRNHSMQEPDPRSRVWRMKRSRRDRRPTLVSIVVMVIAAVVQTQRLSTVHS